MSEFKVYTQSMKLIKKKVIKPLKQLQLLLKQNWECIFSQLSVFTQEFIDQRLLLWKKKLMSDYNKKSPAHLSNQPIHKKTCLPKLCGETLSLRYFIKIQPTLVATCVDSISVVLF